MKKSPTKRLKVFNKTNGRCSYCGIYIELNDFHIDHFIPKNKGGINAIKNLMPSCARCNSTKGTKNIDEFRRILPFKQISGGILFSLDQIDFLEKSGCSDFLGINLNKMFYFEEIGLEVEK